jgi:hypothetical protein
VLRAASALQTLMPCHSRDVPYTFSELRQQASDQRAWLKSNGLDQAPVLPPTTEAAFTGVIFAALQASQSARATAIRALLAGTDLQEEVAGLELMLAAVTAEPIDLLLAFGSPGSVADEWLLIGVENKHPKTPSNGAVIKGVVRPDRSCDQTRQVKRGKAGLWQLDAAVCLDGWKPAEVDHLPVDRGVLLDAKGRTPHEAYHRLRGGDVDPLQHPEVWRTVSYWVFAAELRAAYTGAQRAGDARTCDELRPLLLCAYSIECLI